MGRKRGKSARKSRQSQLSEEDKFKSAPHSFVYNRGPVGNYIRHLIQDVRKVMEPYTATKLKATRSNTLKDFLSIAGTFGVTHFMIFSRKETSLQMKLVKIPRGPTLVFKVESYVLGKDVISNVKKPIVYSNQYQHHPLLIMNGFNDSKEHKLLHANLQSMFPPVNVTDTPLNNIRRCVLVNYDYSAGMLDFRHYAIKLAPVGVSRAVKKIMQNKVPKMGKFDDIAEYMNNPGATSESELEIEPNEVDISQNVRERGVSEAGKCSIRLSEIGPRMKLKLIRIQSDADCGTVLYSTVDKEIGTYKQATKPKRRRQKKEKKEEYVDAVNE